MSKNNGEMSVGENFEVMRVCGGERAKKTEYVSLRRTVVRSVFVTRKKNMREFRCMCLCEREREVVCVCVCV